MKTSKVVKSGAVVSCLLVFFTLYYYDIIFMGKDMDVRLSYPRCTQEEFEQLISADREHFLKKETSNHVTLKFTKTALESRDYHKQNENRIINGHEIHFITYSDRKYFKSKARICKQAAETCWFESVTGYGPEDLPMDFTENYKDVLKLRRGGGYWIWKYPIIEQTLEKMNEGDFIVYLDAGCSINSLAKRRFEEYLAMFDGLDLDILSFQLTRREHEYTTEKIFQYFNISIDNSIRTSFQYVGGVLVLRKGKHLYKWLQLVKHTLQANRWLFTDKYNKEAKQLDPKFIDNRHDQSVSSVSRKIIGSIVIDDESYPPNQNQYPFWASRIKL